MSESLQASPLKTAKKKQLFYLYPFRAIYEKFGVNFDQMIEIVELKSKILGRTEQAQAMNRAKNKKKAEKPLKDVGFFSWAKAISYLVTSLFIMFYGFILEAPTTMLSVIFTVCFVMQFLAIVTSFPVLILDTKDYTILTTKPIDTKTISAAKTTVATLNMLCTTGTLYGFTLVPFIFKGMWSIVPLMLVAIVLSNLICVALSYLLYGLVLKFYDGEKLKDILSGFQIVLTIFIMVGYQLVAQLQRIVNTAAEVHFSWWHLLVPPLWLSNFSATLLGGKFLLPGLLCGGVIALFIGLHFSFSGRLLEENLSKMLGEGESKRGSYLIKLGFWERIARFIYKDKQDQAFFLLGYSVSTNDRKMKQTIYPMYVSMLILPALMIFNAWRENPQNLQAVFVKNSWLVFTLYLAGLTIGSIVLYVKRTEKPQGAWVYETLPIGSKRRAYKAVAMNMILRYVCFPMLLFCGIIGYLAGPTYWLGLCLIFTFTLLVTFYTLKSEPIDWPFSYDLAYAESKKGIMILINLLAMGCFIGVHALCQYLLAPFGVPILLVLTILMTAILWRRI